MLAYLSTGPDLLMMIGIGVLSFVLSLMITCIVDSL